MCFYNSPVKNLFVKPPILLRKLYPKAVWRITTNEKKILLTFDDGPVPEITPWILDLLKHHNIPATFFCVGSNIVKNRKLFERIIDEGHAVGNHTQNHLNNWKVSDKDYLENIDECQKHYPFQLFRPPYGKMRISSYNKLKSKYKIILWDVLSMDYDLTVSAEKCFENVTKNTGNGSVIVFHDSLKATEKVMDVLPKVISYYQNLGFTFEKITC